MKLEEFWTHEKNVWQSLDTKAKAQAAALQARLGDARGAVASATGRLQRAQAGLAAAKAKLAAEVNVGDIPAETVALRKQQALVSEAQGDIARASNDVSDLQATLEALSAAQGVIREKLAAAAAGLADATAEGVKRTAWTTALGSHPLDTLAGSAGDAKTAKGAAPFTTVESKIAAVFGSSFADALSKRHDVAKAMRDAPAAGRDAVIAEWTGQYATPDGSAESVAAWTAAYERAFDALGAYVRDGEKRFEAAMATLTSLAAADLASAAEIAELGAGAFTTEPALGDALALGAARDAALQGYATSVAAFERSVAHDLAPDPDGAVTGTPPDPAPLAAADGSYGKDATAGDDTTSPRALVEQWQTALPDTTYRAIAGFYMASDTLDDLVATPGAGDADTLATLLAAAEDKLATALTQAASSRRKSAFLQLLLTLQEKRVARGDLVDGDLLFALLRGDV